MSFELVLFCDDNPSCMQYANEDTRWVMTISGPVNYNVKFQ